MIQRILLVYVALLIPSSLSAQNSGAVEPIPDWPRFLGRTFDGVAPLTAEKIDWSAEPTFLWSLDLGDGYGIGTVADGRYFQFDAVSQSPLLGGVERLRCIDLTSGNVIWTQTQPFQYQDMLGYEGGPRASPTVKGNLVITLGVTGLLSCRNTADGKLRWSVNTNEEYGVVQNFFGVGSSPLVLGDRVIVMVGGSPADDQDIAPMRLDRVDPNGSAVVAIDLKSGKQLWKCGQDLASYSSPRPIKLQGKTLVLVFARSGLMAIDPGEGQVCWQFPHRSQILESVNAMTPVIDGDRVFISECYEVGSVLLRVDGDSSKVIWQDPPRDRRRQSMRCHWATPILVDGYLYGCSGRNAPDSDFRCIDFQTGELQWSDSRRIRSSLTRVDDHLLVLEERGLLQVIKANSKQLDVVSQWDLGVPAGQRPALKYPCWSAPIVVGTKLLVRGADDVVCFELTRS